MSGESIDATIASIAGKTSVTAGAVSFFGGLTNHEIAAFGGLAVAVIGLLINWYYRHREDQREQGEHQARLDRWHAGKDDGGP